MSESKDMVLTIRRLAKAVLESQERVEDECDFCYFCQNHPSGGHDEDCVVLLCKEIMDNSSDQKGKRYEAGS